MDTDFGCTATDDEERTTNSPQGNGIPLNGSFQVPILALGEDNCEREATYMNLLSPLPSTPYSTKSFHPTAVSPATHSTFIRTSSSRSISSQISYTTVETDSGTNRSISTKSSNLYQETLGATQVASGDTQFQTPDLPKLATARYDKYTYDEAPESDAEETSNRGSSRSVRSSRAEFEGPENLPDWQSHLHDEQIRRSTSLDHSSGKRVLSGRPESEAREPNPEEAINRELADVRCRSLPESEKQDSPILSNFHHESDPDWRDHLYDEPNLRPRALSAAFGSQLVNENYEWCSSKLGAVAAAASEAEPDGEDDDKKNLPAESTSTAFEEVVQPTKMWPNNQQDARSSYPGSETLKLSARSRTLNLLKGLERRISDDEEVDEEGGALEIVEEYAMTGAAFIASNTDEISLAAKEIIRITLKGPPDSRGVRRCRVRKTGPCGGTQRSGWAMVAPVDQLMYNPGGDAYASNNSIQSTTSLLLASTSSSRPDSTHTINTRRALIDATAVYQLYQPDGSFHNASDDDPPIAARSIPASPENPSSSRISWDSPEVHLPSTGLEVISPGPASDDHNSPLNRYNYRSLEYAADIRLPIWSTFTTHLAAAVRRLLGRRTRGSQASCDSSYAPTWNWLLNVYDEESALECVELVGDVPGRPGALISNPFTTAYRSFIRDPGYASRFTLIDDLFGRSFSRQEFSGLLSVYMMQLDVRMESGLHMHESLLGPNLAFFLQLLSSIATDITVDVPLSESPATFLLADPSAMELQSVTNVPTREKILESKESPDVLKCQLDALDISTSIPHKHSSQKHRERAQHSLYLCLELWTLLDFSRSGDSQNIIDNFAFLETPLLQQSQNLLPIRVQAERRETLSRSADTAISSKELCAHMLRTLGNVSFIWTGDINEHLDLDHQSKVVKLYSEIAFCHLHAAAGQESSLRKRGFSAHHGLLVEISHSYRLLFGGDEPSIACFRDIAGRPLGFFDIFQLPARYFKPRPLYSVSEDFPAYGERLLALKSLLRPTGLRALWKDRRDSLQWYTFWAVAFVGAAGLVLGLIQAILAAIQTWATVVALRASHT